MGPVSIPEQTEQVQQTEIPQIVSSEKEPEKQVLDTLDVNDNNFGNQGTGFSSFSSIGLNITSQINNDDVVDLLNMNVENDNDDRIKEEPVMNAEDNIQKMNDNEL